MLMLAGLVLIALLVDRLVVRSVLSRSQELSAEIEVQGGDVVFNHGVLEGKEEAESEYKRLVGLMDEVESDAEAIDQMKDVIDRLARAAEVSLNSWEERLPQKHGLYDQHVVAIREFLCTEGALLQFLHDIKAEPGLLRVDELQISPVKGAGLMQGSMLITKVVRSADGEAAPGPDES